MFKKIIAFFNLDSKEDMENTEFNDTIELSTSFVSHIIENL